MVRRFAFLAFAATSFAACSAQTADDGTAADDLTRSTVTGDKLRRLGAKPCADNAQWLCHTLSVPLDHAAPAGKKIEFAFAVHPAPTATRKGTLVYVTGGPGYAALDSLDDLHGYDAKIPKELDIVRFDLRGVKRSGHLECKVAAAKYYEGGLRIASAADETQKADKARVFAAACVAEMGIPAGDVAFYNTEQATEDLEQLRGVLGEDKLALYGLSFGTQFTQTYTKNHAAHVSRLVIDGVVDLTLSHIDYMKNLNTGILGLLDMTATECGARAACRDAFATAPGDDGKAKFLAAYDAVAAKLAAGTRELMWTKTDGTKAKRYFSRDALDTTTFNALGYPESRRDLQKALGAAFKSDDFLPLLKVSYDSAGVDADKAPPNGTAGADPDMSDAIYYAFTCNDYGREARTVDASLQKYMEAGRTLWSTQNRILSPYYGDLPCVFWPTTKDNAPMPALPQAGVPVMVVGGTGDGATPENMGEDTYRRLADGYRVTISGGHHVMWGESTCGDAVISPFVRNGTKPAQRSTDCSGVIVAP